MLPQVKIFIILFLLFDLPISGRADNFKDGMELTYSSGHEVNIIEMMKGRKLLLALDAMLDYQEPGANPGHEPRKGGGRGP
ncbi:hypothetical protein PRUPE_5G125500 [Prunus persica]|uniref:Uncharacterized protein n=1 Tax=Prunus persica TaxID=3760 RepID=A0A251P7G2_PRUPE|nr:uncharacterized protein LOC109949217 [Prunus persica]ONI07522.1 hypothetical protein PRUPE_5G125500 [Prunus persica]